MSCSASMTPIGSFGPQRPGESFDAMVETGTRRGDGAADPMIACPNSTRSALNERALVMLKAAGELTGPGVRIAGREFQCGDEAVARRNDRTLRASGSRDFVKNGSIGVVVDVQAEDREVSVRFEREGLIRVPRSHARLVGSTTGMPEPPTASKA